MSDEQNIVDKWSEEIVPLLNEMKLSSTKSLEITLFKLNSVLEFDHEKLEGNQIDLILFVILSTYTRYPYDTKFNNLVLQSFKCFIEIDAEKYSKNILGFLSKQSTNPIAIRDILTLIKWNAFIISLLVDKEFFPSLLKVSITTSASLISLVSDCSQNENVKKHTLRAINSAKYEIVSSFSAILKSDQNNLIVLLESLCNEKLPVSGVLALLGLLSISTSSLKDTSSLETLKSKELDIANFIVKGPFSTKIIPSNYSLDLFSNYIQNQMTAESFEKVILPGLEKTSLRNSELTFSVLSPLIFKSLDYTRINVLSILSKSKFLTQLFTSLKATKESVKVGASRVLSIVLENNQAESNDEEINKIIEESFKVLKTFAASAVDQKLLILDILGKTPFTCTSAVNKIVEAIIPYVNKENNELVLSRMIYVLLKYSLFLTMNKIDFSSYSRVVEMINQGMKEKKVPSRVAWICSFANTILQSRFTPEVEDAILGLFNTGITESLLKTFDECMSSPLPSLNNKLLSAGYASIAVLFHLSISFSIVRAMLFPISFSDIGI